MEFRKENRDKIYGDGKARCFRISPAKIEICKQ
jgi:hypothetical protein